jgi:DNA-binding transcriptional LysR family regulator
MSQTNFNDLLAFFAVAREGSFTKAAAKLGVSQSALSQTIRALEERLGLRLLIRTTRSVSPTEAGSHLLRTVAPRFDDIEIELAALREMRLKPAGQIRITAGEHPAFTVLAPALAKLLPDYPDINVEVCADNGMTDIVAERYDAGVRLGDQVAKDMIAVQIGPDLRMAVVATPSYFSKFKVPETPQDLTSHNCIKMRLPTHGGVYAWDFEKEGRQLKVRIEGQMVFNNIAMRLHTVLAGLGIAYLPEDLVLEHIAQGQLIRVLEDWCQPFAGYRLYYPSRRHPSAAFTLVLDALRYEQPRPY